MACEMSLDFVFLVPLMQMKKGLAHLWLLLAAALAIFVTTSWLDPVNVGNVELKRASFMRELTFMDTVGIAPVDSAALSPDIAEPEVVPVDSTAKTILFFGDSMLEGLSPRLADYCKANGHTLYSVIWYSSTTQTWGACDTLQVFLRRHKPDYVFVCLGANELFVSDIANKREQPLRHILDMIGDRPYVWIGPPNWREDTGINDFLQSHLAAGSFFLTNGMEFDRKRDGAHPTAASARVWMDSVARWMPQNCSHPIMMDTPPDSVKGRAARLTLLQPVK